MLITSFYCTYLRISQPVLTPSSTVSSTTVPPGTDQSPQKVPIPPNQQMTTKPVLTKPQAPILASIGLNTFQELSVAPAQVLLLWNLLIDEHKIAASEYEARAKVMRDLKQKILTNVSDAYSIHLARCHDVASMMLALKSKVAYTDQAMKIAVQTAYQDAHRSGPKASNVDVWLSTWETAYARAVGVQLPEV
jgi:hypothetical protein